MGTTQYYVASTIDGFIADENDGLDWLMQFGFEAFQENFDAFMENVGAIVMGSSTYEYILREGPDAWSYGTTPTWVMTTRDLPLLGGADIRFARGDIVPVHLAAIAAAAESASRPNVWLIGGGDLAAQLAAAGLLDELHVTFMPVVLGSGKRLMPVSSPTTPLELLRTTLFDNGAVEHVYRM